MYEEKGVRDSLGTPHDVGILGVGGGRHWCLADVVLMWYRASTWLSLTQCMHDIMNGRLRFEYMIM